MSEPIVIGRATLYLADCRDLVGVGSGAIPVFDPPYGVGDAAGGAINDTPVQYASYADTREELAELARGYIGPLIGSSKRAALTPGRGNAYLYPEPADEGAFFQPAAVSMSKWGRGTYQPILFYGRDPRIGKTIQPLHYTITQPAEKNGHPCPKPLLAWTWLVNRAVLPGETVFDPFMGSGTTAAACARLGLTFIGIERDPGYFDIACKRIEDAQRQGSLFDQGVAA